MRKLLVLFIAVVMIFGMTTAAMAAFQVEVKTNSEGITAAALACEKAGNITFSFDSGTVIRDGDWWTADLPLGVTLCKSMDFVILGQAGGVVPLVGGGGGEFIDTSVPFDDGSTLDMGIWAIRDLVAGEGLSGAIDFEEGGGAGTGMFFRVTADVNTNRITITAYDDEGATVGDPLNSDGSSTLAVLPGTQFQIKLFDGSPHDGTGAIAGVWAYNDSDEDDVYGEAGAPDQLQAVNDWDNSYCVTVDSDVYSGGTVNVSINSGGQSGNNFLSFNPSNPQVAHLISAQVLQLTECKGDLYGFVSLEGGQNAQCWYDYNSDSGSYCSSIFPAAFSGNELIITNTSGNFFSPGDEYRVVVSVSGNGAYFRVNAASVTEFNSTEDPCDDPGSAVVGLSWTETTQSGVAFTTTRDRSCSSFELGQGLVRLTSSAFTGIDDANQLVVGVPEIGYDPALLSEGDQTTVTVELQRLPCGNVFLATRTVAEYVDICPVAAPTTTLYYPYTVALDGSQGWWFGMTIGNPSTAAGTASVTVYERDGDMGTYTTASIPAGGLIVLGGGDLLAALTADPGNAGTLGDDAAHIVVVCEFTSAGGFAMTGNGVDSTGYTAYGNSGTWNY